MNVIVKKNHKDVVMGVYGPYYFSEEVHNYCVELQKAYPDSQFVISTLTDFRILCEQDG